MTFPRFVFLLPALALVLLAGCDDAIETPGSLRGSYTLYGALDPTADTQAVRVVPVRDTIGLDEDVALPISVVSVDLATGAETPWRDSLVTFRDGQRGHVYSAVTRPAYGSRQRFVVRRDEGGEVSALVAVPPRIEPLRRTIRPTGPLQYAILMPDAPQLNRISVTYRLATSTGSGATVVREVDGSVGPVEFGWEIVLDLAVADDLVVLDGLRQLPGVEARDLALQLITIRGEIASEDWRPPGGVFDPDVLADPEALTNVRGGFGFVGAAYPFTIEIVPTPCDIQRTRFRPDPLSPCVP